MEKEENLLYHYTSLATLKKIIKGIQNGYMHLRAGNAKKMKDPTDCYYFLNLLCEMNNDEVNIKEILREKETFDNPYIISLTSSVDDLYMWENYGDKCNGIAIGIGIESLYTETRNFFLKYKLATHLYRCRYIDHVKGIKEFDRLINNIDSNGILLYKNDVSNISNLVKKSSYTQEKEFRIVIEYGKNEHTHGWYNRNEDAFFFPIPLSSVKKIIVGHSANYKEIEKNYSIIFQNAEFVKSKIDIGKHEQDMSKM